MLGLGLGLPQYLMRQRGIWTPAALFAQGQQGVWYEPKPQYLYQDAAGTVPVTADGDPVGYMQDLSGNGNHATQSTSAARPTYPGLEYDGVDDSLTPAYLVPNGEDFMISVSVDTDGISNRCAAWSSGDMGSGDNIVLYLNDSSNGDVMRLFVGGGIELIGPDIKNTGKHVITVTRTGSLYVVYLDGTQVMSRVGSAATRTELRSIGAITYTGPIYEKVNVGAMVSVETTPTDDARTKIESYLANLAGVTL